MKSRTDTRRLYHFEAVFLHTKQCPGNEDTSIYTLREIARRVWRDYGNSREIPRIIAGRGCDNDAFSYYEVSPVNKIVLKRTQRTPTVLLHELTHALGKWLHNRAFCKLYFELLHRYLGYDLELLKLQAANFKIRT